MNSPLLLAYHPNIHMYNIYIYIHHYMIIFVARLSLLVYIYIYRYPMISHVTGDFLPFEDSNLISQIRIPMFIMFSLS